MQQYRGYASMMGHVRAIVPQDDVAERVRKFFRLYGEALEVACALPVMTRLRCVSQLGAKYNTVAHPLTMPVEVNGALAQLKPVPVMSRWQHSRAVASHAVAIGLRLGWEYKRVLESALGALCHDLGHPMFSHAVEPVLARYGLPNHEMSGQALVQSDVRLRSLFAHLDVSADRVVAVMQEQGDAGAVQNVADTLAYVEHDSMVTGVGQKTDRFSQRVVDAIDGVAHGVLQVREMVPLAELLSQRAGLSVYLYEHPVNRMCNTALVALCEDLIVHRHLTPEQVASGIDTDLWSVVDAVTNVVPDWVTSIIALLRGAPEELARWGLKPGVDTSVFYGAGTLYALNLGRKSYHIVLPSGLDHVLRTDPAVFPKHLSFQYTLVFLG